MLNWLTANIGTVLITLLLIAAVTCVIIKTVADKRKGRSSCSCGCEHCAMRGTCHQQIQRSRPAEKSASNNEKLMTGNGPAS